MLWAGMSRALRSGLVHFFGPFGLELEPDQSFFFFFSQNWDQDWYELVYGSFVQLLC